MRTSIQSPAAARPARGSRAQTAAAARKYVYAIIEGAPRGDYGMAGIDAHPIEFISGRDITSVVSAIGQDRIRPERRHLAAHRDVLRRLIEQERAGLPVGFGTIASGPPGG